MVASSPVRSAHLSPTLGTFRTALAVAATATLLAALPARADRGQWTPMNQLYDLRGTAIHMALLPPGYNGSDHSRIVWWERRQIGGVLGWSPPSNEGCDNWPSSFTVHSGPAPAPPGVVVWNPLGNIFCGGLVSLSCGELLALGGHETPEQPLVGLARASTLSGAGAGTWNEKATMWLRRWYPTGSVLGGRAAEAQGRVLVGGGSMFPHVWLYGGYLDGAGPAGPMADSLFRYGWPPGGSRDPAVLPRGIAPAGERPAPRAAHTAAFLQPKVSEFYEAYFGGKGSDGNTVDDQDVWLLTRGNGMPWEGDYTYDWSKLQVTNPPSQRPDPRHDHIALAISATEMVIFGGAQQSGGSETVRDDFWHVRYVGASGWTWAKIRPGFEALGTPPTARWGHAAVYDAATRRMILFGGTEASGQTADQQVYVFTFDHTAGSPPHGTWSALTVTGTPPAGRRDHTMVLEPDAVGKGALIYGGRLASGAASNELWWLDLSGTSPVWRDLTNATSGPSPGARYSHSASYSDVNDGANQPNELDRMLIYGGDGPTADNVVYRLEVDALSTTGWVRGLPAMEPRHAHNLVLLPTGEVLAEGGTSVELNSNYPVFCPQLWNPTTFKWSSITDPAEKLACDNVIRGYHSVGLLLPDARVLTAGSSDTEHGTEARIFCPPYLFKTDGTTLATRPVILEAPASITWRQSFTIRTDQAAQVVSACLIRPGATTHGFDQSQRFVPLTGLQVLSNPPRVMVTAPASPDSAPPGYYLLFILKWDAGAGDPATGVPSIAKWVKLQGTYDACDAIAPATTANLSATLDQATCSYVLNWTAPADDGTDPASGPARQYEIRIHSVPITDANWNQATSLGGPLPGTPGTTESWWVSVESASYVRLKTRDDKSASGAWSGLSNQRVLIPTLCDGFSGGGEGGGGFVLAGDLEGPGALTGGLALENSLFEGAAAGEPVRDVLRLPGLEPQAGAYHAWVRTSGAQRGSLDRVGLLVVDHGSAERAVFAGAQVVAGAPLPPVEARLGDGADVLAGITGGEGSPWAATAGQTVTLTLAPAGLGGPLVVEAMRNGPAGPPEQSGIRVQVPEGTGWRTVAHLYPRRQTADLAAEVGAATQVRLEFLSEARVGFVGQLARSVEPAVVAWAPLQAASKASGEDARVAVGGVDSATVSLAGPDTLDLTFAPPLLAAGKTRDCFLWVEGTLAAVRGTQSARAVPRAEPLPARFALFPARPNPFTQRTLIRFALPVAVAARLEVFDIQGRRVRTLHDGALPPGYHAVEWDGRDGAGQRVARGTYFYALSAGSFQERRKMTLSR